MTLEGASRASWTATLEALAGLEADPAIDRRALAAELYSVSETLAGNSHLCQALGDKSRDAWPKRALARRLLAGRISEPALQLVEAAVSGRWRVDRDLYHALERCGHDLILAAAQADGLLDQVERELIEVEEKLGADPGVREALYRPEVSLQAKVRLVTSLLEGKVLPDTLTLAIRPVINARGRRFSAVIWRILALAARRREKVTARVTSARPLSAEQVIRLTDGLSRLYGRDIFVSTQVDPALVGGLRVLVGDEVIDASIERRLAQAGRELGRV